MTASKDSCHLALPDLDPSIALAQAARQDFEREFFAHRPTVDQLIERGKNERAAFIAALLRSSSDLLKSTFRASAGVTAFVRSKA
jgi:hypothetical protein